jgi:hypothetical protein
MSGATTGPAAGGAGPHPSIRATWTRLGGHERSQDGSRGHERSQDGSRGHERSQDGSRGRRSRTAPVHPRHVDVAED